MGLETGTGIGDLVPTNPLSTDAVSVGDDHIRLIKTVMQSITFLKSIQSFTTVGANTWTRPANVKKILVYCLGGGAGGGGGTVNTYSGGGGSGGATAIKWLDVSALASGTVTVGAAGTGGAIAGSGTDGGPSAFSDGVTNLCLAAGGKAGGVASTGGIGLPRSVNIGDLIVSGGCGQYGAIAAGAAIFAYGGIGGGAGGTNSTAAEPNSGGGGGGGPATSGVAHPGANGGSGQCVVFEFGW